MSAKQQVLQVVTGDGEFNAQGVRQFVSAARVDTAGVDYQTIAITGPQSSGKSTLMNALVCALHICCIKMRVVCACICALKALTLGLAQIALSCSDQAVYVCSLAPLSSR